MPFTKKRDRSPSSTPVPSTEAGAQQSDGTQLPSAAWSGMQTVLNAVYDYRTEDGLDPSKLFHRKVNKRVLPEYYDTIKEPIALSTIKAKINTRAYQTFPEFVRDFALIPHNAQVFNRPASGAFQDALVIKELLEQQLQKLVTAGVITKEVAELPNLGEIPTFEDLPVEEVVEGEAEEEEESDEEGEDDEEDDGEVDEDGKRKKKRGPRAAGSIAKREVTEDGAESKRPRGRPPKLLTPMEARIQAILKGIRKPKNQRGQLIIKSFDRLPDKTAMPEYFVEVKQPMAYDLLKRKVKRKKYRSVEEFMADVNLMFNNAKSYNTDESQIYQEATVLQVEAGRLYDIELAKPDDTFADEEGKIPMPNGILHNGELYKVGDWVHIQNPNDLTKPIPAQIYRTYKNPTGQSMVNVCWFYRPEQTVHRFDKHFLPNEVVKTGRYRDHHVEEIEGRCFIMFFTRFFKGRPRGLSEGIEIYVCEARYNETQHQFNKIKTWASCLPDEVRDKDYEMDLFDHPRKMKKFPSPIAYMLKDEQKESDDFPKVQWGADGAPPKIGAVHRRPRGDRDSAPPEPTPPPPPKMPTPPPRQMPPTQPSYQTPAMPVQQPVRPPMTAGRPPSYSTTQHQSFNHPSASPAPQQRPPSAQSTYTPQTPQALPTTIPRTVAPASTYQLQQPQSTSTIPPNPNTYAPRPTTASNYRDPPPIEVYILPDQANLSIPPEVREQYQRDEHGRVLFFTAPPVAPELPTSGTDVRRGGHSISYLAERARRKEALERKRRARNVEKSTELRAAKRARLETDSSTRTEIASVTNKALRLLERRLVESIDGGLGDVELGHLSAAQKAAVELHRAVEANAAQRVEARRVKLGGGGFADDWDNRLGSTA